MKKYLMIIVLLLPLVCQGQIIITKPLGAFQIGTGYTYNCTYFCHYAKGRIGYRGPTEQKIIESRISYGIIHTDSIGGIGIGIGMLRYNKHLPENPLHFLNHTKPFFIEACVMRNISERLSVIAITDLTNWETEFGVILKFK